GGGVQLVDLDPTGLLDVTIDGAVDGTSGAISGTTSHGPAPGIQNGVDFLTRNNIGIFRAKSFHFTGGTISFGGNIAFAMVSDGPIIIDTIIDAKGTCTTTTHGPGGFSGGAA